MDEASFGALFFFLLNLFLFFLGVALLIGFVYAHRYGAALFRLMS